MNIKELAFTGYPVTDMARARKFYEGILGLKKSRHWGDAEDPSWIEYDVGAGCLAIINDRGEVDWPPANAGPAVALEVDDFAASVQELKEAKVHFLWEPQDSPSCSMAVINDPDGNRLVIHQRKAG